MRIRNALQQAAKECMGWGSIRGFAGGGSSILAAGAGGMGGSGIEGGSEGIFLT
jgi:hypothetical protein